MNSSKELRSIAPDNDDDDGDYHETFDATIKVPFGCLIYGAPQSGKSHFIKNLLVHRERLLSDPIDYIVYFYGENSKTISEIRHEMTDVILVEGLPDDFSDYIRNDGRALFLFDDLMDGVANSKEMVELVTKKCQHRCISWIVTFQNAFHHGTERVSITRAANSLVVFNSPLDKTVPHLLATRIMPQDRQTFLDIFEEATRESYSYLFCDGHPRTPSRARLRSHIFGEYQLLYIPTKK